MPDGKAERREAAIPPTAYRGGSILAAILMNTKYIFVTGGVVSGLGKGITAASLGRLLKQRGLRVKVQKLDPYLNVDRNPVKPLPLGMGIQVKN